MSSINSRITSLYDALERRRMELESPVDKLSQSLYELEAELAGLDTLGKAALLGELNRGDPLEGTMGLDLTMQDVEKMVEAINFIHTGK